MAMKTLEEEEEEEPKSREQHWLFTPEKRRSGQNAGGIQLETRWRSLAGGGTIRFKKIDFKLASLEESTVYPLTAQRCLNLYA